MSGLSEREVIEALDQVLANFESRHEHLLDVLDENYAMAAKANDWDDDVSRKRKLLIGAYLTMEYSIESVALFNPSIVEHPDQRGVSEDAVRFVLSLRATGEGHVSSIVFRTGIINGDHSLTLNPPARFSARARLARDQYYLKPLFRKTLNLMSVHTETADAILRELPDRFTFVELEGTIRRAKETVVASESVDTFESMMWLARSNYQLQMEPNADVSDIVIFPQNDNESRGCEDLRLVRFLEDDGSAVYFGTYTAYNGYRTLPMLLETKDFMNISVHTLNGACAQNKGMALFPRRINGHYVMCSRIDGVNLYIMYSDFVHFWESAELLAGPKYPWEMILIGNCGSPLETPEGWLLITHGVGAMRRYCIGAMLLDLDDPLRVIGRLRAPLLTPTETEREGYVPNVVYSCGAMIHRGQLFLPYAMSDKATSVAAVALDELLERLRNSPP